MLWIWLGKIYFDLFYYLYLFDSIEQMMTWKKALNKRLFAADAIAEMNLAKFMIMLEEEEL